MGIAIFIAILFVRIRLMFKVILLQEIFPISTEYISRGIVLRT